MINTMISLMDNESVKVQRKELTEKPDGSQSWQNQEIGNFQMSVQGIRSSVKVEGYVLNKALEGAKLDSTFICYSQNVDIKAGDIIKRTQRDKKDYEVLGTEPKGVGTILEHRVSIISRLDNQPIRKGNNA